MQVINTNVPSLNAQRNTSATNNMLATSLQRLSSGLRINSAKDDAAGLAISERFTTQIRGINQAVRNSNDGISLAQTAEGAMGEITNNLQRIRELSVQSANATNSSSDRAALQFEVSALVAEIDRVSVQSNFNGAKLLDGTFANQVFQVGANQGETITVGSIASARTNVLGGVSTTTYSSTTLAGGGAPTAALAAGDLTINGSAVGGVSGVAQDARLIANAVNGLTATTFVTATASASTTASLGAFTTVTGTTAGGASYSMSVGGVNLVTSVDPEVTTIDSAYVDAQIATNAGNLTSAGLSWTGSAAAGNLTFTKADGSNLTFSQTRTGNAAFGYASANATFRGTVSLAGTGAQGITIAGSNPARAGSSFTAGNSQASTATTNVSGSVGSIDISSVNGATAAMGIVDNALGQINTSRASLGAIQNRFQSVVVNLQTASENLSASRSRIRDADFAKETAELTRAQILQQAGIAMLAQANALPQTVLSLLR